MSITADSDSVLFQSNYDAFRDSCLQPSDIAPLVKVQTKKGYWNITYAEYGTEPKKALLLQGNVTVGSQKGYVYFARIREIITESHCRSGTITAWEIPEGYTAFDTTFGVIAMQNKFWKAKNVSDEAFPDSQKDFFSDCDLTRTKRLDFALHFRSLLPRIPPLRITAEGITRAGASPTNSLVFIRKLRLLDCFFFMI